MLDKLSHKTRDPEFLYCELAVTSAIINQQIHLDPIRLEDNLTENEAYLQ